MKQPAWVLILLFAITFNFITAELLPMGVLQVMASDLGQTEARIGFLVSIFAFAVVVTSAPLAGIMARLPRRPLLVSILTVLSLGNIAVSFSDSYALDIVIRFVTGIMHGIFWGMIGSLATRMVPVTQRGRALSAIFTGNVAAMSLGIPLSAAAGLLIGWRPWQDLRAAVPPGRKRRRTRQSGACLQPFRDIRGPGARTDEAEQRAQFRAISIPIR